MNKIKNEFKKDVKLYISIHKELHGLNADKTSIANDLVNSFDYSFQDCINEIEYQNSKKYGIFLCRCQPFHDGHNEIIQEIIRDGKEPIIILGGNGKIDERHPLNSKERAELIKIIYPEVKILFIEDNNDWNIWFNSIEKELNRISQKDKMTLYYYEKEEDKTNFTFDGNEFDNCHYYEVFKMSGYDVKNVKANKCSVSNEVLHGTDIRKFENIAKNNLDARVFRYLKDIKGWWK